MGWLYIGQGHMGEHNSPKRYLDAQFTYEHDDGDEFIGTRVLESSCPSNSCYYAALERYDRAGERIEVLACICMVRWNPKSKDGMIFGYKDTTESMGPVEDGCPERILALLTPTNHPYALDWRRRCHRKNLLKKRKLKTGDLIRLPDPLTFTDGSKRQEFEVNKEGRKILLMQPGTAIKFQISRLLERPFKILKEPKVLETYFP